MIDSCAKPLRLVLSRRVARCRGSAGGGLSAFINRGAMPRIVALHAHRWQAKICVRAEAPHARTNQRHAGLKKIHGKLFQKWQRVLYSRSGFK